MEPDRTTEETAARWFARLGGAAPDAAEMRAFRDWLEADPAHAAAFEAVRRMWADLRPAAAAARVPRRRRALPALAAAAAVAAAVWAWPGVDLAAPPGPPETYLLADGSRLTLEAGSEADIAFAPDARRVELRRGRLFVEVTPDAARPFVVAAAGTETEVRGTAFGVALEDGGAEIAVEHGRVEVRDGMGGAAALGPGEAVAARREGLGPVLPAELDAALAWRRGLLAFEGATLQEAAAELARVSGAPILVPQPGVRALRLSGMFRAEDPEAALAAIAAGLGLQALRLPGATILIRR